ncbi:hypothetical protein Tco_0987365, partial [Tanacetum coccineum]
LLSKRYKHQRVGITAAVRGRMDDGGGGGWRRVESASDW